jgi:hypothetical protein
MQHQLGLSHVHAGGMRGEKADMHATGACFKRSTTGQDCGAYHAGIPANDRYGAKLAFMAVNWAWREKCGDLFLRNGGDSGSGHAVFPEEIR